MSAARTVLFESIKLSGRVDKEAGVIRRVKILGLDSVNGRKYLKEAVAKAVPLYEGASVRLNHPKNDGDTPDVEDVIGWLKDVSLAEDGCPYGDLHLLKEHPATPRILEAATRNPELFALSHNVPEGCWNGAVQPDGTLVVSEIREVRSVDLVADGATNKSLFESRQRTAMKKIKVNKWLKESLLPKVRGKNNRILLTRLVEDSGVAGSTTPSQGANQKSQMMEMEEPGQQSTAEDGLKMAAHAILDDESLSADEKCTRLKDLLKLKEKHAGMGESEEDLEEEDSSSHGSVEKPGNSPHNTPEKGKVGDPGNIEESVRYLQRKDAARTLCETKGRADLLNGVDGKLFLDSLIRCPDDASMGALLEREIRKSPEPGKTKPADRRPRSSAGSDLLESVGGSAGNGTPSSVEEVMSFCRNGGNRSVLSR